MQNRASFLRQTVVQVPQLEQRGEMAEVARRDRTIALMRVYIADLIERLRLHGNEKDRRLLGDDHVIQGVTARVLKDCLYALQYQTSALQHDEMSVPEADAVMKDVIPRAFDAWWSAQRDSSDFLRLRDGPAASETLRAHGELPDEVWPFAERIDASTGLQRWHAFERVRTARVVELNAETFPDWREKIHATYQRVLLKDESLEKLATGDYRSVEEFRRETRKGVFVFDIDEPIDGGYSVAEQMDLDFEEEYGPREQRYVGKALVDGNDDVLAWVTYWQTPRDPNGRVKRRVHEYLARGVTGKRMKYTGKPGRDEFMRKWRTIQMFDTICGAFPMASARLFAKVVEDMLRENPDLQDFVAYRLYELFMKPSYPWMKERLIRFAENKGSDHFFERRGCEQFAFDYNEKGPKTQRLVHGNPVWLHPMWVAFSGEIRTMLMESWAVWRAMQQKYGDVTDDAMDADLMRNALMVDPAELDDYMRRHRL